MITGAPLLLFRNPTAIPHAARVVATRLSSPLRLSNMSTPADVHTSPSKSDSFLYSSDDHETPVASIVGHSSPEYEHDAATGFPHSSPEHQTASFSCKSYPSPDHLASVGDDSQSHLPRTIVVRIVRTLSATFHYIDSDASSTTTPYSFERMPGCILVDHPWSTMPAHALNLATSEYSRSHCRVEPTTNVADQRPRRADLLKGAAERPLLSCVRAGSFS